MNLLATTHPPPYLYNHDAKSFGHGCLGTAFLPESILLFLAVFVVLVAVTVTILLFSIKFTRKINNFAFTCQIYLNPILPTLSYLSPTCNFTKIQKVYILCRYWLKRKNTPYGKANLAIRCILIISHFP